MIEHEKRLVDTNTVLDCIGIVPKINEFVHCGANVLIFFILRRERERGRGKVGVEGGGGVVDSGK